MPIITLYGPKGSTGLTTSAVALALRFLSVNFVDATQAESWIEL